MSEERANTPIPEDDRTVALTPEELAALSSSQAAQVPDNDRTVALSPEELAAAAESAKTETLPKEEKSSWAKSITGVIFAASPTRILRSRNLRHVEDELDGKEGNTREALSSEVFSAEEKGFSDVHASYSLGKVLGEGGQGIVVAATDTALKRNVAVKSLRKEHLGDIESRRSFISEARITASLEHPAVIPVYSLHSDSENGLHLAMKLLRGQSLRERLEQICQCYQKNGIQNYDEAGSLMDRLNIFLRVTEAMAYVHAKGIIHCDLKPDNIMLGQYHETYILDWGIARDEKSHRAGDEKIMGTPRYTSPENLSGQDCDRRSDIYTLGVILFELVTLHPAFFGANVSELVRHVKSGETEPLRHQFGVPINRDLKAIIRKAMAIDPAQRYQQVEEFTDDLNRCIRGAEVSANPDNWFGKIVRKANQHRRAVFLTMLVLLLGTITISAVSFGMQTVRASKARHLRDAALNQIYSEARNRAEEIGLLTSHIERLLSMQCSGVALLLEEHPDRPFLYRNRFISQRELEALPQDGTYVYTPDFYAKPISLMAAAWRSAPDSDPALVHSEAERLRAIYPWLQRTVLNSSLKTPSISVKDGLNAFRHNALPLISTFFSLKSGLHATYPGKSDYSPDYDGRKREWYSSALNRNGAAIWGKVYFNTGIKAVPLISCSMEIRGRDGEHLGVTGVDLQLEFAEHLLLQGQSAAPYTLRRMLINKAGMIPVLAESRNGKIVPLRAIKDDNGVCVMPSFQWPEVLRKMRAGIYGGTFSQEGGKTILWVYSRIPSLGWIYVEKIDFAALLKFMQENVDEF